MNPCIVPLLYCLCGRNRNVNHRRCEFPAFTISKIDAVTGMPLAGAVFHIRAGSYPVFSGMTDECGNAVFLLQPGIRYVLYEAEAPCGYERHQRSYTVYANRGGMIFVNGRRLSRLCIEGYRCMDIPFDAESLENGESPADITYRLQINRYNSQAPLELSLPFSDVIFEIRRADGHVLKIAPGEDREIRTGGLADGIYQLCVKERYRERNSAGLCYRLVIAAGQGNLIPCE